MIAIEVCNKNFTRDQLFPYCERREKFFPFLAWKSTLSAWQNVKRF
jgi:hypothetical protein